jgi:ABC-type Fe3+ transport system permease subunit
MSESETIDKTIFQWIKQFTAILPTEFLITLSFLSLLTLLLTPLYLKQLPQDYFIRLESQSSPFFLRWMRNIIGVLFIFAGLLMVVLPGQGLLTLLIGLCLIESPLRKGLIKKLTQSQSFRHKINTLRRTLGSSPFIWHEDGTKKTSRPN